VPELIATAISKRYGSLTALDGVSATFRPGEIHAVVGENGAGKSTFVGILAGFVRPDSGSVRLDGESLPVGQAFEYKRRGIEMIHQHFTLVPAMTVSENLALGRVASLGKVLDASGLADRSMQVALRLGWKIDGNAAVGDLSVGTQQRVEILKALGGDADVLIFDEPTAVLAPVEVEELLSVLRTLRDDGKTVILIAHKLAEIMAVADHVTVLRRGKWVASARVSDTNPAELAQWMVGDMPSSTPSDDSVSTRPGLRTTSLSVAGDRGNPAISNVDFEIQRGEVLGFGGVDGNGQVELAEALVGIRPFQGSIAFADADQPDRGYVPQDRQVDGLALTMSVKENLLVTGHRDSNLTSWGWLRRGAISIWATALIERFGIKVSGPNQSVSGLSGGNQQKVVVSRALEHPRDLLVFVNPTRGLDLRATQFVHEQIRAAQLGGAAIALITTDLDELYALSSRTKFLSQGRLLEDQGVASLVGGIS
jgi:simple sugar transport system ATP-binding protein